MFRPLFAQTVLSRKVIVLAGVAALALQISACTPTVETRGNLLSPTKIEQVEVSQSIRADVERIWGPPTTVSPFNPNIWYYIGETTSQQGVFEAKVEQRQIVQVTFDDSNTVTEIAVIDPEQAREVDFIDRRTPTAGREFTAFQQFVGNLGKFNSNIDNSKRSKIPEAR
ncbi:MAG TPA: outer membrane protein assembly factor BamE [Alphaproteobacteria bacterium]|nr:outer membrane protein assembly factor BamE [Alphaproteobacteria bacterium]